MIHHSPVTLPPIPHFPLPGIPPSTSLTSIPRTSLTASATISESSTRLSDVPSVPAPPPPPPFPSYSTELNSSFRELSKPIAELLPPGSFGDHAGYIPILPRTNSASGLFKKRCETCTTTHDGSFGAGRFCSSRCARTVGGLAHRKKRMLERGAKAKQAAENRVKTKKARMMLKEDSELCLPSGTLSLFKPIHTSPVESPRSISSLECPRSSVVTIDMLLNPTDN